MTPAIAARSAVRQVEWRGRFLAALVGRELASRYRSALFGWLWPILIQLAQLLVFTYLFAAIFRVRMQVAGIQNGALSYGLWLFTALVGWNCFQSGVIGAANAIVGQPNLVKRVVFPLALLPLVPVFAAVVEALVGFVVVIALTGITTHVVHPTVALVPIVLIVQVLLTAGIAYFAAGLTVFVRDVPQALSPLFLLVYFLTPIVYPPTAVPAAVKGIVLFNPIAIILEAYRSLVLSGTVPFGRSFAIATVLSIGVFYFGWRFFNRVRPSFGDVV